MKLADTVIKSNAIFDGKADVVFKGGVAIKGNKIAAIGDDCEIGTWIGQRTKVLKFEDEIIMPGFIDAHVHFFSAAHVLSKYIAPLLFEANSAIECGRIIGEYAEKNPEFNTIVGFGWSSELWSPGDIPHCRVLDSFVSDRPVFLHSGDCHNFWLNSKALEICAITKETKVTFGEIGKDDNGELNGLLYGIEAGTLAAAKAYSLPINTKIDIIKDLLQTVLKNGITSITNMSGSVIAEEDFTDYEAIGILEKEGALTVRMHLYPSLGLTTNLNTVKELREQYRSGMLQVSGLKQFVDGITQNHTGYLLGPYNDKSETSGAPNYAPELYKECIASANKEGFGVRLHCAGDAAVRLALDSFEESCKENDNSNIRNCIEHIENIHPDDIPRFATLGVIASMQPLHLPMEPLKVTRIGEERAQYEWAVKTLLDNGATLAFGTDYPAADLNPFVNIYTAVTRCNKDGTPAGVNPQERISLAAALRVYTYGSACSINREDEIGTLEEGKLADIIVLNKNLFSIPACEILNTQVILTMLDGNIIFNGV